MEKMPKLSNTNSECETDVDVTSPNKWSSVASKRPYNKNKARNSDIYLITQPIEHANRYTMLTNLPETTICHDGNVAPKITKATQISTNNYVKKMDHGRIRKPSVIRHPQLPPSHHEVQSESTNDQNSNFVPTIVNGQINPTKKDNNLNSTNNKLDHIHNLLRESTTKLLNNKAKYSSYCKHKVLLMGDSHLRGCAAKMIASLDACFEVCGVVKPGLATDSLTKTAKGDVGKLMMNDFLIICSGTNDIDRNYSRNAFKNITNFTKSVNHTNIILISKCSLQT